MLQGFAGVLCSIRDRHHRPVRAGLPDTQSVQFSLSDDNRLASTEEMLPEELMLFILTCPGELLIRTPLFVGHNAAGGGVIREPESRSLLPDVELFASLFCDLAFTEGSKVPVVLNHAGGSRCVTKLRLTIPFGVISTAEAVATAIRVKSVSI